MSFLMDNFWLYMLSLLAMSPGAFQTDFLALVPTDRYLQHQQIELKADKLLELAKKSPKDAKGTAQQLLAIRWFGENKDKLGDQQKALKDALETLVQGPAGFARDYARVSLALVEGKALPTLHLMPKGSVRTQALEWFPDDVALVGALDLRTPPSTTAADADTIAAAQRIRNSFMTAIPPAAFQGLFGLIDRIGNFRIDRVAFAYRPDPTDQRRSRIFVRLTGQGDARRFADVLKGNLQNSKLEERPGPNGLSIRIITQPGTPVFAFIGDTDFLICDYDGARTDDRMEVFEQFFDVMTGKRPSVVKGPFARTLQVAPEEARGLVVGTLPEGLRKELAGSPLAVAPLSVAINLTVSPAGKGSAIHLQATFDSEADAKKFADGSKLLVKQGVEGLKMLPFKVKPESTAALQEALEGIDVKAEGTGITGRVQIAPATMRALADLLEEATKNLK